MKFTTQHVMKNDAPDFHFEMIMRKICSDRVGTQF